MNLAVFKKYLALEIAGLVILTALAAIGVKLSVAMRRYAAEKGEIQSVLNRKQQLDRRVPYPSAENVRRAEENYKDLLDAYNELNERLRARQIEPQAMQAADFMPLLERSLGSLRSRLAAAQVEYPPRFAFGFERYAGGKLPAAHDIPRLVQQLKIIEALCQALAQSGAAELISFSREEFENALAAPGASRSPSAAGPEELYTTMHFKLAVKAGEASVIDLLNRLARLPVFTVVTSVDLVNTRSGPREGAGRGGAPAAAAPAGQRKRPIILGNELLEMRLELDVYQFAPSLNFRGTT